MREEILKVIAFVCGMAAIACAFMPFGIWIVFPELTQMQIVLGPGWKCIITSLILGIIALRIEIYNSKQ